VLTWAWDFDSWLEWKRRRRQVRAGGEGGSAAADGPQLGLVAARRCRFGRKAVGIHLCSFAPTTHRQLRSPTPSRTTLPRTGDKARSC
jgi:hypothetical protein